MYVHQCTSKVPQKANDTLRSSQAVPHLSTNRALQRLTSEFGRDPVLVLRYGRKQYFRFGKWLLFTSNLRLGCVLLKVSWITGARFNDLKNSHSTALTRVDSVGWPSGLRRQFKALVSSEAWVRIPLQSALLFPTLVLFFRRCVTKKYFP